MVNKRNKYLETILPKRNKYLRLISHQFYGDGVEDIFNEVVAQFLEKYEPSLSSPDTYFSCLISQIIRNKIYHSTRTKNGKAELSSLQEGSYDPNDDLENREKLEDALSLMNNLAENYQCMAILRDVAVYGMNHKDVADKYSTTIGNVKVSVHTARKMMRDFY